MKASLIRRLSHRFGLNQSSKEAEFHRGDSSERDRLLSGNRRIVFLIILRRTGYDTEFNFETTTDFFKQVTKRDDTYDLDSNLNILKSRYSSS